jgi:hypothetical protein
LVTDCPGDEKAVNEAAKVRPIVRARLHCSIGREARESVTDGHVRRPRASQVQCGGAAVCDISNVTKYL